MGQTRSTQHVEHLTGPVRGVNTRTLSSKLQAGEFSMLRNLDFSLDVMGYTNSPGTKRLNGTSAGSSRILGLKRWYKGAQGTTRETVVAHGTQLYTMSALGVLTSIGSGFTANSEWFFEAYNPGGGSTKLLFAVNGANAPRRWDGSTLRTMGFPAPSGGNIVAAVGAAGALTGDYSVSVTFIYDSNEANESSAGYTSNTVTLSADKLSLTGIPTGGTGCTGRKLYRTKAGGNQRFFIAYIQDNSTTVYVDETLDSALSVIQAPVDNGVPPSDLKFLMIRKDRAYGIRTAFPNRLYMSAIYSTERGLNGAASAHGSGVEIWPSSHYIEVGDDGAPLVTLEWFRDRLIIFARNRIFIHNGAQLVPDMRLEDVGENKGCCAARSVKNMGSRDGIFYLGTSEGSPMVYRFNGASSERVGDLIEPTLKEKCVGIGSAATVQPCAGRKQGRYFLGYATNLGGTEFEIAELDTKSRRWQFHDDVEASVFAECDGPEDTGELLFGHARHGYICEWGVGCGRFNADDVSHPHSVTSKVVTGWLSMEAPNSVKQLSNIDLVGEAQAAAEITIERAFNFDTGADVTTQQDGGPDVEGTILTMEARFGQAFHKRVNCGLAERRVAEQGFAVQLDVEFGVPASSEGAPYTRASLHDILLYYVEKPPTSHEAETRGDDILAETE